LISYGVKYSQGKWGFSVQKQIYVDCGAKLDGKYPGDEIWHEFCRRVGWMEGESYVNYSDLTFHLEISPAGEFPVFCSQFFFGVCVICYFFSRIQTFESVADKRFSPIRSSIELIVIISSLASRLLKL
jgi:hypothetical protein